MSTPTAFADAELLIAASGSRATARRCSFRRASGSTLLIASDAADDAQICNCNGVCKSADRRGDQGRLSQAYAQLWRRCTQGRHRLRSCKPLVQQADRSRLPASRRATTRASTSTCPGVPLDKAGVRRGDSRRAICTVASPPSSQRSPADVRIRPARRGLRRCSRRSGALSTKTNATRGLSTTASTPISRRTAPSASCRASTAASPRADELHRIADVAEKYNVPHGEDHRRPADRPARRQKRRPAGGLAGPWHALRVRLYQGVSHLQDLRRDRILPLRRRRQHRRWRRRSKTGSKGSSPRTS